VRIRVKMAKPFMALYTTEPHELRISEKYSNIGEKVK
jgi:hypothetical protein